MQGGPDDGCSISSTEVDATDAARQTDHGIGQPGRGRSHRVRIPSGHGLRSLTDIRPLYIVPNDPWAEHAIIPCFRVADSVDSMVGYFSSEALAELAPGLATFVQRSNGVLRLIICPILSAKDLAAIHDGTSAADETATVALSGLEITEDSIARHTLTCLTWLLRSGRIEIKVALMQSALFHPKVWLFRDREDVVALHGSSNLTHAGIRTNIEQIAVSRSWDDEKQQYTTARLEEQFAALWSNADDNCIVVQMPDAIRERLVTTYSVDRQPTEDDLRAIYVRASQSGNRPIVVAERGRSRFRLPRELRYRHGPYAHQGAAVDAWCKAGHKGVLEMATGSGKTIAALVGAHRLYQIARPLVIVVAAPYIPLIQQWCDEVRSFGITAINLADASGPQIRANQIGQIQRRLRSRASDVELVVVSHSMLSTRHFQEQVARLDCKTLLIADEAHNLGSEGFISEPPNFFDYRLGLSATPIRQYDDKGTKALLEFLGPVVFRFTLKQAIGNCLVEYDYCVHPVRLTEEETERWHSLTDRIRANVWRANDGEGDDTYLSKLLRDRRAILELAANKLQALETAIGHEEVRRIRHALIYASDKGPDQLEAVNRMLKSRGVLFHQLTHVETADREKTRRIVRSFQDGTLRVLTAKRVLDEGVNIPQIRTAFILASTTVERQWVQRRGRLLRRFDAIGKTHAEVHDFVALPSEMGEGDGDCRSLLRSELQRVQQFAALARNAGKADGPLRTIDRLVQGLFK